MTSERQDRMKMLRRLEDRKKRLPTLLVTLSGIATKQFSENDVLTIEQIDEYQIHLNGSDFGFNFLNISFPVDKASDLLRLLHALKDKLSQLNYFSLSH